jgi:hypothetical protein
MSVVNFGVELWELQAVLAEVLELWVDPMWLPEGERLSVWKEEVDRVLRAATTVKVWMSAEAKELLAVLFHRVAGCARRPVPVGMVQAMNQVSREWLAELRWVRVAVEVSGVRTVSPAVTFMVCPM